MGKGRNKSTTLWSNDFTIITLGTIISAIGGVGIHFCMGIVVFDNTSSTWLTGLFSAVGWIPAVILPILIAPYIDRVPRKNMIVRLDFANGILYLLFALILTQISFSLTAFIAFALITNSIGTVYQLTYTSLYPDLIPKGFARKGYSVSSLIYPSVTAVITPLTAVLYKNYGITPIFAAEGCLLLIAAAFERQIKHKDENRSGYKEGFSLKKYISDLSDGIKYLKKEKGVRSIYSYMVAMSCAWNGNHQMMMAHFVSTPRLGKQLYAFLTTAETVGRMLGGFFHYFVKIPFEKRYWVAEKVYIIYTACDGILLFVLYPVMLVLRFICGFLGVNSMTLRESATQNYIHSDIRARANSVFSVISSVIMIVVQLAVGAVGEFVEYRFVAIGIALLQFFFIYLLVVRNKKEISLVYNREH